MVRPLLFVLPAVLFGCAWADDGSVTGDEGTTHEALDQAQGLPPLTQVGADKVGPAGDVVRPIREPGLVRYGMIIDSWYPKVCTTDPGNPVCRTR